jgi:hypothetical protein
MTADNRLAVISLARLYAVWMLLGMAGRLTRMARKLMQQPLT